MKNLMYLLTAILFFGFAELNAQTKDSLRAFDLPNSLTEVYTTASFGKGLYNENYFFNTFGINHAQKINDRMILRIGGSITDIHISRPLIDRSPKNTVSANMSIGMSYNFNDKMILSADVFVNTFNNTIGADFGFEYFINESSKFEFSATFIRQLQFSGNHQPVPYGYNDVFHPYIFGY